jgi:hypothetical protein
MTTTPRFDLDRLYELLPAVHRVRDAGEGKPLESFLGVIAEQVRVLEESLDQYYDDQFVETCAEWVLPYLGDLLGVRPLTPLDADGGRSLRAYIANTMAYRRRKGTPAVLEQLALDVTGWRSRVVEFFQLLATAQHLNHLRRETAATADLRRTPDLDVLDGPFDVHAHTADVRRPSAPARGRYNIPHVGIFLWRLEAYPMDRVTPKRKAAGRYHFSPLGHDMPLFNLPRTEAGITHLAEEINVPGPIRPLALDGDLEGFRQGTGIPPGGQEPTASSYYGSGRSLAVFKDGQLVSPADVVCLHLGGWVRRPPAGKVAIDPARGRLAFPAGENPSDVRVSYSYGFSGDMGGGPYDRQQTLAEVTDSTHLIQVAKGTAVATIQGALAEMATHLASPSGADTDAIIIRIEDSAHYQEPIHITLTEKLRLVLEAADGERPTVRPQNPLAIEAPEGSVVILNGLLVVGTVQAKGEFELRVLHSTLVPGRNLKENGDPTQPNNPSLFTATAADEPVVRVERSIIGAIRLPAEAGPLSVTDSVIDAPAKSGVAVSGPSPDAVGPVMSVVRCTVFGEVRARRLELAEDSIFTDRVRVERRQKGCCRFCSFSPGSLTPRRYRCQPDLALAGAARKRGLASAAELGEQERGAIEARLAPGFTSTRYGTPAYAQLRTDTAPEIRSGAEDGLEIGVFNRLEHPRREANLKLALEEYLRFGFEAGLFFVT